MRQSKIPFSSIHDISGDDLILFMRGNNPPGLLATEKNTEKLFLNEIKLKGAKFFYHAVIVILRNFQGRHIEDIK